MSKFLGLSVIATIVLASCNSQPQEKIFLPDITLVPLSINSQLPALRDPIVAVDGNNWLIIGGSTGNLHSFDNTANNTIYVYTSDTMQLNSVDINSTDLPTVIQKQLVTTSPEYLQDGNTLYMIGGYDTSDSNNLTTSNTISSMQVHQIVEAVLNHQTNLAQFTKYNTSIPQFKVTGGQLNKIGSYFYLVFGQDCEGAYCATSQTYTNTIYQFTMDPTLSNVTILNQITHADLDRSGWRRRDYTLASFIFDEKHTLFAMGGPFTPGNNPGVWTNGILFSEDLKYNNYFIRQQANQYLAPRISMYSAKTNMSYAATIGGLSTLYWSKNGLVHDNTIPYGNILDLISADASGKVQEYANLTPVCSGNAIESCLYMGLSAAFIPIKKYYDTHDILQLDQMPNTPTLIGYVYAGLVSPTQNLLKDNLDYVTNQVYGVYITPNVDAAGRWKNITNLY